MAKHPTSMRLSDAAARKLAALTERYGNKTTVIEVALDRLYTTEVMMLSRTDEVQIVYSEWRQEKIDEWWLILRTSRTGDQEFRRIGSDKLNLETNQNDQWAKQFALGETITLGQLHRVPINRGLLAVIEPGVLISVGEMHDGLTELCGPLAFAHYIDNRGRGPVPTQAQQNTARRAAEIYVRLGEKAARRELELLGLFERILDGNQSPLPGGPAWGSPDVWEVR